MKFALSILALSLAACGGGGGGSGGSFSGGTASAPATTETASTPVAAPVLKAPAIVSPNCTQDRANRIACDMISSEQPIGTSVPAGMYAMFKNNTGVALQIIEVSAFTGERDNWSEYCAYRGFISTWQSPAGVGEVGCATKQIGEDYAPIHWGVGTGLIVNPGDEISLNAHTDPLPIEHTYMLKVQYLSNGVQSWRQPQVDQVIACNDQLQSTVLSPWRNDTGHDVQLTGASIYSEEPSTSTPNTLNGSACITVMVEGGAQKYSNCDSALRTRGEVNFPPVTVAPGEYVAAQANNTCKSGVTDQHWNWVAFLNIR